jgi:hypothetical protein
MMPQMGIPYPNLLDIPQQHYEQMLKAGQQKPQTAAPQAPGGQGQNLLGVEQGGAAPPAAGAAPAAGGDSEGIAALLKMFFGM